MSKLVENSTAVGKSSENSIKKSMKQAKCCQKLYKINILSTPNESKIIVPGSLPKKPWAAVIHLWQIKRRLNHVY